MCLSGPPHTIQRHGWQLALVSTMYRQSLVVRVDALSIHYTSRTRQGSSAKMDKRRSEEAVGHIEDTQDGLSIDKTDNIMHDGKRHARLRHKIDRRLLPLFCWLYLLNYLDRSNIGNAKILNDETGDSFL